MTARKKIPVIKNRLPVLPKNRSHGGIRAGYILLVFLVMLFFVWLRVQTNQALTDIRTLEKEVRKNGYLNSHLETEVNTLLDYNRIAEEATEIGLVPLPNDKIIKITKKE